jgi:catecholate siderophore receptor
MSRINERPATKPCVLASALGVVTAVTAVGGLRAEEAAQKETARKDAEKKEVLSLEADSVIGQREDDYKVESASKKFTAPLRETPKSVTIISQQVIEDTGSLTLVDALRTTSGITFGAGEGGNPAGDRPIIRGFNAESDTFIDGLRDVASQTREIFNIEQIEVSKGPGSAYTGAGSTGGSINMITKTAKRNDFLDLSQTFGSDQTRRSTLDFNRMLTDQIGFRLNLMKHDANVAGRDGVDVSRWGFAPTITFGFDTPTRATFSYYHVEADDMPDYGIPVKPATASNPVRKPVNGDKDHFYGLTGRDFRESSTDSGTFRIEHDINENVTISNTFRQVRTTLDYIATNPNDSVAGNLERGLVWRSPKSRNSTSEGWVNQTDIQAKFNTGFIEHTMVGGIEITDQDVHNRPYAFYTADGRAISTTNSCNSASLSSGNCTTLNNPTYKDSWDGYYTDGLSYTDTDTQTKSAYLFDTLKFNDKWSLNLGLRYDDFETESSGYSTGTRTQPAGNFKLENNNNFWSHQLGVVYNPLPNGSIYAAWSTSRNPVGETAGEGNDSIAGATQDLEPERNRNIELGTKWEFFDGRLALDSAIFKTKKSNARVTDEDGRTQNMGEVEIKGFELGVNGRLTREWQVFANYTYLDSEIVDGGVVGGVDGANDGNENPSTPENSFSFWSTYQLFPFLTVGGGANYVDSRYGNAANTIQVSSYWRYDAMANLKVSKSLDLQLNIQNLTDKRYFDQVFTTHMAHVAPGRTVLLATNFHF